MKDKTPNAWVSWRFYFVLTGLACLSLLLVARVVSLQVLSGVDHGYQFLQGQGQARAIRTETIPAHRGMITDRHGEPVAVSTPVTTVWANPKILFKQASHWPQLAEALDIPYGRLQEKLARYEGKGFIYLKRHMTPAKAEAVLELKIAGVYGQQEYKRFYPAGEIAAHLVGFTNIDEHGQEGIELAYDSWLKGEPGEKRVVKDLLGRPIKDIQSLAVAKPGKDIALSIDLRIQTLAYRELKAAIKRHGADSGSVVVLDVRSGEVLAMANQPSYNPNNRRGLKAAHTRNRAVTDVFEPGSTVKPLTMMAALESGQYTSTSLVDTSPGYYKVGKKTLLDPVNYGLIDLTKVLAKSSQVGTTKVALSLDERAVHGAFYRMGLGQDTGSGFPGESTGKLPNYAHWKDIDRAAFAFGHGLSVTALQLARVYSTLANQGVMRDLSLIKNTEAAAAERVVDADIAASVVGMLKAVTKAGGTATKAQVEAYSVAGKTGTSHKVGRRGYEDSEYRALFAGMAPASQPRIVTVVVVDDPKGDKYYGGEVAAPVFSKVVAGTLRLMNVAPDDLPEINVAQSLPVNHRAGVRR